jgi:hypothetical protein
VRYCEAKGDAKDNSSASWAQAVGGKYVTCVYAVVSVVRGVGTKARASRFGGIVQTSQHTHFFQNQTCVHACAFIVCARGFISRSHCLRMFTKSAGVE